MAWSLDILNQDGLVGSYGDVTIGEKTAIRIKETRIFEDETPTFSRVATLLYTATDGQGDLIDRIAVFGHEQTEGVRFPDEEGFVCIKGIWVQATERSAYGPHGLMVGTRDESGAVQIVENDHEATRREWHLTATPTEGAPSSAKTEH